MLVISRYPKESFVLCVKDSTGARQIVGTVHVVSVRGGNVKIGIKADRDIEVVRTEIYEEKRGAE
jgi:carbon storage regulator CsrA